MIGNKDQGDIDKIISLREEFSVERIEDISPKIRSEITKIEDKLADARQAIARRTQVLGRLTRKIAEIRPKINALEASQRKRTEVAEHEARQLRDERAELLRRLRESALTCPELLDALDAGTVGCLQTEIEKLTYNPVFTRLSLSELTYRALPPRPPQPPQRESSTGLHIREFVGSMFGTNFTPPEPEKVSIYSNPDIDDSDKRLFSELRAILGLSRNDPLTTAPRREGHVGDIQAAHQRFLDAIR